MNNYCSKKKTPVNTITCLLCGECLPPSEREDGRMCPCEEIRTKTEMTREEVIARARTLRPIAEFKAIGGMRYWVDGKDIHSQSYTWDLKRLRPTGYLEEIAAILTYHDCGHPSLFKPSVEECVRQCPYPEATAFRILPNTARYMNDRDCHEAVTVYYKGPIPEDILNMEIKWEVKR